jgi:hypothetical protein
VDFDECAIRDPNCRVFAESCVGDLLIARSGLAGQVIYTTLGALRVLACSAIVFPTPCFEEHSRLLKYA